MYERTCLNVKECIEQITQLDDVQIRMYGYATTRCAKKNSLHAVIYCIRNQKHCVFGYVDMEFFLHLSDCFVGTIHEHSTHTFVSYKELLRIQSDRTSTNNEIDYIHPFIHLSIQSATEKAATKNALSGRFKRTLLSLALYSSRLQLNFIGFRKHSPKSIDQFIIIQCDLTFH